MRLQIELLENRWVPTTIIPTTFADGGLGSGSLRDAVLQFNADTGTGDDTIQLLPGTYTLTIPNTSWHQSGGLDGDLYLTQTSHRWIIQGAGPSTIIDASQLQDRVFQIVNPGTQVVFQDLVIQGGLAQDNGTPGARPGTTAALGGAILNNGGNLTLNDVVVQSNGALGGDAPGRGAVGYSARGAGIYSTSGALTIAGATIATNQGMGGRGGDAVSSYARAGNGGSSVGGGLYASGGSLDVSDSMIANNRATGGRGGDGGSYYTYTATGTHYYGLGGTGGTAQGGGLYVTGGSLTVASSPIASNQVTGGAGGANGCAGSRAGGGLYIVSNVGTATVTGSTLASNFGAGIVDGGTLTVCNSTVSGNSDGGISNGGTLTVSNSTVSGNSGGGIVNSGTLAVSNSTLSNNSANDAGGGIYNVGTLTVTGSTLSNNSAFSYGGGIYNWFGGTLTLTGSTLSGNSTNYQGGGIYNETTLTVSNSTLSNNSSSVEGGGIENWGTLAVSNSTLSGNSAGNFGGGIANAGGMATISNSTLSGNSANGNYGFGGGIWNGNGALTVSNSTLSENRAVSGGGGLSAGNGLPVLHNTLIAGNFRGATGTTRDDVSGHLDVGGDYNLIGDGTGMTGLQNGVNGNLIGRASAPIDPLLDALDNYGGPTETHALLAGSPALDAGNPNQLGVPDQRGVIRTGGVNIGAYQASASAFVVDAPATVTAGVPFDVTVTAVDPFRQAAVGYTGTVTFSTTDPGPGVVLPADYTYTPADGGTHTFTDTGRGETTLITAGDQLLTVTDTVDDTITGSATVSVDAGNSAPAPDGAPQPFGPSPTGTTTPVQNVKSSSANAAVERFFTALAEEESTFPWLRWEPGEPAGCVLDLWRQDESLFA
jgi:hypothetical protein